MFNFSREETKVDEFPRYKVQVALTNKFNEQDKFKFCCCFVSEYEEE